MECAASGLQGTSSNCNFGDAEFLGAQASRSLLWRKQGKRERDARAPSRKSYVAGICAGVTGQVVITSVTDKTATAKSPISTGWELITKRIRHEEWQMESGGGVIVKSSV
jgi:hypothetical protein